MAGRCWRDSGTIPRGEGRGDGGGGGAGEEEGLVMMVVGGFGDGRHLASTEIFRLPKVLNISNTLATH